MNIFAKRLKLTREKMKKKDLKWTQAYVADLVGVARTTYTAYENGTKQPPLETVNKLAEVFEASTDWLLGREEKLDIPPMLADLDQDLVKKFIDAMKDTTTELFFDNILNSSKEEREVLIKEFLQLKKAMKNKASNEHK